jgi:phage protein D
MAVEKISRGTANFYVPRYEIEIQGSKMAADMSGAIISVSINERLDVGSGFEIKIYDEFDLKTRTYKWLDHPLFNVGNTVKIKLGYESSLEFMLVGNITGLAPDFFAGETPTITVRGQDLSYDAMKRSSPGKTYLNMSYSDIAGDIGQKAGLSVQTDKTGKFAPRICKSNQESYFTFLEKLAREIGFQFKIDRQTLYFNKPGDNKKEILAMELGKDIISFTPELDTTRAIAEVEVRGHNPRDPGTPIIGRAAAGSERSGGSGGKTASQVVQQVHHAPKKVIDNIIVTSVQHANAVAQAVLNQASDKFIGGEVQCIGLPLIKPGVNIKLEKMGKRFSGKYYVVSVVHAIDTGGYKTTFIVKRNAL